MPLNLHLLRMFTTVVRTGSFSRAADALHISQPAISKGVRDFELQIGCRLLDRIPKGVRPTREGLALMRRAEALFATEREAEEEMRSLRGLEEGSLRIGASTTIASYMIAEYLGIFHSAYPNNSAALTTGGGLVFTGLTDGTFIAYDDTTFAELWKINVGTGFNAPPMTFEVGGKQYVAILAGLSPIARRRHQFTPELREMRNQTMLFVFAL